ncbi:hypothetical protein CYY_008627 [Polysphondylium violaceum]|uniref:NUC153 domain-containing protein n=1 Tax=Polysphondylium violaceum TaxID=133409 RepID=A0A8J4PMV0_9MYCE|nr:hypothetical protein CYY_008627 [Polysphondylium violaceum]
MSKSNNNGGGGKKGGNKNTGGVTAGGMITDPRFISAHFDPRHKMTRKNDQAVKLDSRFGSMFTSRFISNAPTDEYGRKIEKKVDKSLKNNYTLDNSKQSASTTTTTTPKDDKKSNKKEKASAPVADSRFTTSSKLWNDFDSKEKDIEEDDEYEMDQVEQQQKDSKKQPAKEKKEKVGAAAAKQQPKPKQKESSEEESQDEEEEEEEDDENVESIEYGGFEYNSDTESSDAEEYEGDEVDPDEVASEEEDVPRGDATRRFAVLNCDWDNVNSKSLFILLSSFVPKGGFIKNITVYPSDYGLKQMAIEKQMGPSKELWDTSAKKANPIKEADSTLTYDRTEDAESFDGKGFNLEKLRQYELSKLKYYYAVVECDSVATANNIYDEVEGTEIEDTANVLDLRFIPDEQEFTNTPRDSCDEMPTSEVPKFDFSTSILKGTTVDFTWDVDKNRRKLLTKNYSKEDAKEEDLRAYLADPESSDESMASDDDSDDQVVDKKDKKSSIRAKYRDLLLSGLQDEEKEDDIKVTFTSAFSDAKTIKDEDSDDEEDMTVSFEGQKVEDSSDEEEDDDDDEDSEEGSEDSGVEGSDESEYNLLNNQDDDQEPSWAKDLKSDEEEEDDVREMVINTDLKQVGKRLLKEKQQRESANVWSDYQNKKKDNKNQKRRDRRLEIQEKIKEQEEQAKKDLKKKKSGKLTDEEKKKQAELELLMMDDDGQKKKGFNKKLMEIQAKINTTDPLEKKKLEKKLKKKNIDIEQLQKEQDFKLDVNDERFPKIFTDPAFAIDPTAPQFKRHSGMVDILKEKQIRRKAEKEKEEKEIIERRKQYKANNNNENESNNSTNVSKSNLLAMAENIKRKAENLKNNNNLKKQKQ